MSSRKEKFLESARKSVVKGQLDRAIKDYEQVVAIDPLDMKHRQKLAELLVRVNRHAAAIKEYEAIGKYYADNSYYLKAIAVYKQVQKLDPTAIAVSLKLAEYNKKQGLTGNALAEYAVVYNYYQGTGNNKECFKILDKMLEVDPDNLNTLLKYAEARYADGFWDEAYHDFSRLALQLLRRGDKPSFDSICDRIQRLYPDRHDFILEMLEAQIENGEAAQAIPRLQEIIKRDNFNMAGWRLLAHAYAKTGDSKGLNAAFRYMLHFFPNELYPREAMVQGAIDEGNVPKAVDLLTSHLTFFIEHGEFTAGERLCYSILELVPDESAVYQLLRMVYEASGEAEKLAAIEPCLSPPVPLPQSAEPEPEPLAAVEDPVAVPEPEELIAEADIPWEDELDLSLVEDLVDDVAPERAVPVYEIEDFETDEYDLQEEADSAAAAVAAADDFPARIDVPLEGMEPDSRLPVSASLAEPSRLVDTSLSERPATVSLPAGPVSPFGSDSDLDLEDEGLGWLSDMAEPARSGADEPLFTEDDLPSFSEFSSAIDSLFPEEVTPAPEVVQSKYNPDHLLSAFKRGVDEQLDDTDSETHYNLGIAYKEMGLLEDAVHELQIAGGDPQRAVDCMTLQGICYRDKGDFELSEEAFKTALAMKDATVEELASATYELAFLYETVQRVSEARSLYLDVEQLVSGFRDASARGRGLHGEEDGEVVELEETD